jgi:hypothetical protein
MATTANLTADTHGNDSSTTITASTASAPHLGDPSPPNYLFIYLIAGIGSNNSGADGIRTEQDNPSLPYQYNIGENTAPWLLFHSYLKFILPTFRKRLLFFYISIHTHSQNQWLHGNMISQPPKLIPASKWFCHFDAWRAILVDYFVVVVLVDP